MDIRDQVRTCKICGALFDYSISEQIFFKDRGLNDPVRCRICRVHKKDMKEQRGEANDNQRQQQ